MPWSSYEDLLIQHPQRFPWYVQCILRLSTSLHPCSSAHFACYSLPRLLAPLLSHLFPLTLSLSLRSPLQWAIGLLWAVFCGKVRCSTAIYRLHGRRCIVLGGWMTSRSNALHSSHSKSCRGKQQRFLLGGFHNPAASAHWLSAVTIDGATALKCPIAHRCCTAWQPHRSPQVMEAHVAALPTHSFSAMHIQLS